MSEEKREERKDSQEFALLTSLACMVWRKKNWGGKRKGGSREFRKRREKKNLEGPSPFCLGLKGFRSQTEKGELLKE